MTLAKGAGNASAIANEHVVPKRALARLIKASDAPQRSAPWVPEARAHLKLADGLEPLLSPMTFGIDPATRQSGVPGIV